MVFIFSLLKLVENNVFVICPWPCFFITGKKKTGLKRFFQRNRKLLKGQMGIRNWIYYTAVYPARTRIWSAKGRAK